MQIPTNPSPCRGLSGEATRPSPSGPVEHSSAPGGRAAAAVDEGQPEFSYAFVDMAWIALEVAHATGLRVRGMRWGASSNPKSQAARRLFYLVARELTQLTTVQLADYVNRTAAQVESELRWAGAEEREKARHIAERLVLDRRAAQEGRPTISAAPIVRLSDRTHLQAD